AQDRTARDRANQQHTQQETKTGQTLHDISLGKWEPTGSPRKGRENRMTILSPLTTPLPWQANSG
ncbi:MAG: hypothetical protein ACRELF_06690, partial [Gemmataceae bacterium]